MEPQKKELPFFTMRKLKIVLMLLITTIALYITDPAVYSKLGLDLPASFISIINIAAFAIVGFFVTTMAPDIYMDREYRSRKDKDYATLMVARAIHTLGFCVIFATSLYIFIQ